MTTKLEEYKEWNTTYFGNSLLFYPEDEKDMSCYSELKDLNLHQDPVSLKVDLAAKTLKFSTAGAQKKKAVSVGGSEHPFRDIEYYSFEEIIESLISRNPEVTIHVVYVQNTGEELPVIAKVIKLVGSKLTSAESYFEKLEDEFALKYNIQFNFEEWCTLDPVLYSKGIHV